MKKSILTAVIIISTLSYSFGQKDRLECSELVVTVTDKMTETTTTSTIHDIVVSEEGSKEGFNIFLMLSRKTVVMGVDAISNNCIDKGGKMLILFRDGTRIELLNQYKYNCNGKFRVYFGGNFGKYTQFRHLKNKEIETIRIWTSDSYVQNDLTHTNSKELMESFKCIASSKK